MQQEKGPLRNQRSRRSLCGTLHFLFVFGLLNALSLSAATTLFNVTNSANITINDAPADNQGNPASFGRATPYPSTISVSGLTGEVSHVTVTVWKLAHTSCSDISMLLVSPQGHGVVLMSQVGGANPISVDRLTFDDSATTALYTVGVVWAITNGVYLPTDSVISNYFMPPAPPGLYSNTYGNNYDTHLSALNGTSPNGTWSLYVQDEVPLDTGGITNGWTLNIATAIIGVTNAQPPVVVGGFNAGKTAFQLSVPTVSGVTYVVEYTDVLPAASWSSLATFVGDGNVQFASDEGVSNQQRFYRVRIQ